MTPQENGTRPRVARAGAALERRLLLGVASSALVLLVAVFAFAQLSSVRSSKRLVEHTLEVIAALHEVQTALLDAETGQRGYLLTADPAYLAPYGHAAAESEAGLLRLRALIADNPEQQRRLGALEIDVRERLAALSDSLHLLEAGDREGAIASVRGGHGKRDMDAALLRLDEMFAAERSLLLSREATHERDLRLTTTIIAGGSVLAFCLTAAVSLGVRAGVMTERRAQGVIDTQTRLIASQTGVLVENADALRLRFDELGQVNHELDAQVVRLTEARTEAERALAELRITSSALERANRDLDHFAYATSHDLKAPLRGIASLADWLEEDLAAVLTPRATSQLRLLHGRVARMETLIDGILAYSRAARTVGSSETIDLLPFLRGVVELVSPPDGVVTIDVPIGMPSLTVQVAPFQQVWMNLIGNALKHGAREHPAIRLAARHTGEGWELSVTDNGPGIPRQYHERVFRIFHTLASRDTVEGAGIGLAIVKRLVEDRGGRVWIESADDQGTRVCFTWPDLASAAPALRSAS